MTANYLIGLLAVGLIIISSMVFVLWADRRFPFANSCLAQIVLFVLGFASGFLMLWAFQPGNLTVVLCLGPLVGIGVGSYTGLLLPTITKWTSTSADDTSGSSKE